MSLYVNEQIISRKELKFKHRYMFRVLQAYHHQAVQEDKVSIYNMHSVSVFRFQLVINICLY